MKALTLRQPWAFCITHGTKRVENRTWGTSHRGLLAIHAGARSGWDSVPAMESPLVLETWARHLLALGCAPDSTDYPDLKRSTGLIDFSAIVAVAEVTGCHHADDCIIRASGTMPASRGCSRWGQPDQWHWELAGVRPLATPVPCRGALGLWTVPDDAEAAVAAQLEER
jgi:hypothetical protein